MKIFLSSLENSGYAMQNVQEILSRGIKMKWNLISYFYARRIPDVATLIRDNSELLLVDSGAHSFQKGAKVDFDDYAHRYAAFIKDFDRPNVLGYFELDVDNVLGLEKVLQLRSILEAECGCPDKIIPVWHRNRGVDDFKKMCRERSGSIAAITGFKNEDIRDDQYLMFLKYARQCGTKLHCLGMTREPVLQKVPFDFVDSSSWVQNVLYGTLRGGIPLKKVSTQPERTAQFVESYIQSMEMQERYFLKWRGCNG